MSANSPGPRRRAAPRPVRPTRADSRSQPGRQRQTSNSTRMLIDAAQLTLGACLSLTLGGLLLAVLVVGIIYFMK